MQSNQMLIKPSNRLQERALFRILLNLLASIASHGETVDDTTVQINLVRLLGLNENRLGLVTFLGGEDLVRFCGCDGEGPGDCCEFGFFDEGRMSEEADIDAFPFCQEADGVFRPKTIPNASNLLESLLFQPRDSLLNNRIDRLSRMRIIAPGAFRQPTHEIKALMTIQAHRITVKKVRNQGVVSIGSVLVGHQLRVLPDADHIRQEEDRGVFVDGLSRRLRDVGIDAADFDTFAGRLALVLHTNGAAGRWGVGSHCLSNILFW